MQAYMQPQVYKVCPRNRSKLASNDKAVAITFNLLKPYFKKPLAEASEELGLSATAIKKACRTFGIPKWPFRTLSSKASRNRSSFQAINLHLESISAINSASTPSSPSLSDTEDAGASSCEEEEQAEQQPATRPASNAEEECWSPVDVVDSFAEFANPSASESEEEEFEQTMWGPAPLEIYTLEEAKESELKTPKMRVSEDAYMTFLDSEFEEPFAESYDSELFNWNIGM